MGALTTASNRTSCINSLSPVGRGRLEKMAVAGVPAGGTRGARLAHL